MPTGPLGARLVLPAAPSLAGKTLRVRVNMVVTYPHDPGRRVFPPFQNRTKAVSTEITLHLAPAGSSEAYRTAGVVGASAGTLACLLGGLALVLLAVRLRIGARPPQLIPLPG